MPKPSSYQIFASPADWRTWLQANYANQPELWLAIYKKGAGKTAVTYEQAVEEALCYGCRRVYSLGSADSMALFTMSRECLSSLAIFRMLLCSRK